MPVAAFSAPAPLRLPDRRAAARAPLRRPAPRASAAAAADEADVVLVGSGLGSLCTAALLTAHGRSVRVLESHTAIGGAAHSFRRRVSGGVVTFESGPHLFSGLQGSAGSNPLRDVLSAANVPLEVIDYDAWGVFLPNDQYVCTRLVPGAPLFHDLLSAAGGPRARADVDALLAAMAPAGAAAVALPPAALRARDLVGTLRVASRFAGRVLPHLSALPALARPFEPVLRAHVDDPFARQFLNLLCFLLAGVQADRVPVAEIAFMLREWDAPPSDARSILQRPRGGAAALATALATAVERDGRGVVRTGAHVDSVLVERGRATGVRLRSGEVVRARRAVVAGVSAGDVGRLVVDRPVADADETRAQQLEMCDSFMHLHVAVELTDAVRAALPDGALEANYVSVEDWTRGVDARDNVVLISVPSAVDDTVAPPGWAVVHAYTPAVEPFADWAGVERGSAAYEAMKKERSDILFRAVARVFGQDVRDIAEVVLVGTPLTHSHFLRRDRGSYGPMVDARNAGLGLSFGGDFQEPNLFQVGDGVFPGVGVPAVAGSAWVVANTLVDVDEHVRMLERIGL